MNKKDQELRKKSPIQIRNKKASFEYFFVDTYTAGIVLTGTEIKSIRGGKASLVDCYCDFYQGELWVKGMNISPYSMALFPIMRLAATASSFSPSANCAVWKRIASSRALPSCLHLSSLTTMDVPRWISPSARVRRSMTSVRP